MAGWGGWPVRGGLPYSTLKGSIALRILTTSCERMDRNLRLGLDSKSTDRETGRAEWRECGLSELKTTAFQDPQSCHPRRLSAVAYHKIFF